MEQQNLEVLQKILTGLFNGSQQHYVHATINKKKGFNKTAHKMMLEYNEEVAYTAKFIDRILELGGIPGLKPAKIDIHVEIESQLKAECREQFIGLDELQAMYNTVKNDVATQNLLIDYIKSETEHGSWLKQQVNLMDTVGIQNYLAAQI